MHVDTLIKNGTIVTVNPAFEIIKNGWIGIKDGMIVCIGGEKNASIPPDADETLDVNGAILLPGLVNTHTHLPMTLFRGLADDLPLMEWLNAHMFPAEAAHVGPDMVRAGTLLACAEMLLSGTTTCCDGYFFEDIAAGAVETAGMRAILGQGVIDFPAPGVPDPKENVAHALRFAEKWKDRSPLITPSIFCHSPYTCGEKTLKKAKAAASKRGLLFQIHAAETKAELTQLRNEKGASPIGYLDRLGLLDSQTLLVHTIWVDKEDIALIARRNAAVSVTTESEMKLASGIAPLPDFVTAGIRVGLGTDGCASNNDQDMFQEMDMTAKLHKVHQLVPTVMDARTVLTLATMGGALAIGMADKIGSLEIGKQADLIVTDTRQPHLTPMYSPASHAVYAAKGSDVSDVMVAGRWLVRSRELLTLNREEIIDNALEWGRVIGCP
jgi:5-methylthioadenosine/S-adenosylhomocysteine deaminase